MVKIEAIAVDVDGTITDGRRRVCHSALDALRKAEFQLSLLLGIFHTLPMRLLHLLEPLEGWFVKMVE